MSKIRRIVLYFSEEELKTLKEKLKEIGPQPEQNFIREIIRDKLNIELQIKNFHSDALCPKCGPYGQIVSYKHRIECLNCGYTKI